MATITSAWNIAVGTLQADQSALNVVSNNISNSNTTGYSREEPTWTENSTYQANGLTYGQGASVTGIQAIRDSVLEKRITQQTSTAAASEARLSALDSLQSVFTVDTGSTTSTGDLSTQITDFFNSLKSLESSPNSSSLRESVLSAANTLAQTFDSTAASLEQQRIDVNNEATSLVSQINALTTSIAKLNDQIANSATTNSNSLVDQRQNDLNQLADLVGIQQSTGNNGTITVTTTSGDVLVDGDKSWTMSAVSTGIVSDFYLEGNSSPITSDLTSGGGELGGYLTARDVDIPKYESELDNLAYSIASNVNTANEGGYTTGGAVGTAMFSDPGSSAGYAATMSVTMTNVASIAVSSTDPTSTNGGDYDNLSNLADLVDTTIVSGQTPTNFYSAFVSDLGSLVSQVNIENTAQQSSLSQLQSQRDSLSAVSLDEEAANLSTYEKAYQSASKLFSVLNSIMEAAINLGTATTY